MDRMDKLLRAANPVPEDLKPPRDPFPDDRQEWTVLPRDTGRADNPEPVRPATRRPARRTLAAVAVLAATVMLGAAAVTGLLVLPVRQPVPASPATTDAAIADGWRLAGFVTDPWNRPDTIMQFRLPPGWNLGRSGHDPDTPDPEFPAVTGYLFLPTTPMGAPMDSTKAAAMAYYGPIGGKYDPAACLGEQETYTELDSIPVDIPVEAGVPGTVPPRFVFRVVNGPDGALVPSFGITTRAPGGTADRCTQYFHVRAGRPGFYFILSSYVLFASERPGWLVATPGPAAPSFATVEDARAFLETDRYRDIKRLISSVTITAP